MARLAFQNSIVAGLLFGSHFLAQAQTASTTPGTAVTTGIVGVTSTQSVRLNALNLQPVIPGVTAIICAATLEIYDDSGALLTQMPVTNISPATAAALVYKPTVPSTPVNARAQIRGVVFTPAIGTVNPGSGATGRPVIPASTGCNFMVSLEITDDMTGATHLFTTDVRTVPSYRLPPVPVE
jgi:hypothetical protein